MSKTVIYSHQLNNSELARTGTHETYVSIPRGLRQSLSFFPDGEFLAKYKRTGECYKLSMTTCRNGEFRVTKMGKLYRASNVSAGDIVVIEGTPDGIFVDFVFRPEMISFGYLPDGFLECRNVDRLLNSGILNGVVSCVYEGDVVNLRIENCGEFRPRVDSPRTVVRYRLFANDSTISLSKNQGLNLHHIDERYFLCSSNIDTIQTVRKVC